MIRAFIVDDEEPARERLRRLLAGTDLEIVGEAGDGGEALARIAELAPDLVFLDIQMPGVSGLDVAARLSPPRPRLVFCTAFDRFAIDAFEHQAVDYLLKPVNTDRLRRTVGRVAGEIEEQRRQAHEEREAVRTQERLMPAAATTFAGLDCAGICLPARGLGGDYYDFLALGAGCAGLALGDVSGKGTYAGLLVAALQARMQAVAAGGTHDPAALLRTLNSLTVGTMDGNRFATVFFAVYVRDRARLRYASAGHPPAVIVGADGSTRELTATGPVVGWTPDAVFGEEAVGLGRGDVLAISSDGITEAADPSGDPFGTDGLARAVRDVVHSSAADIIARVIAEVDRWSGSAPAEDDRTLVIARVL